MSVRILHVDDDPHFAELAADVLEREDDRLTVETAASAGDGVERLAEREFDCVVSDYDMPRTNGIEFLNRVREMRPDLPFILFTGKGSEAVASDAISAGVTDYLQKQSNTSQYELLANRITNAVEKTRAEQRAATTEHQYTDLFENAPVMHVTARDEDGTPVVEGCNDHFTERLGYDQEAVVGRAIAEFYTEASAAKLRQGGYERALRGEFGVEERTLVARDGETIETLVATSPRLDEHGDIVDCQTIYIDITERKRRETAMSALHDATQGLMAATDEQTLAERAVETAHAVLDRPINALWLDDGTGTLRPAAVTDEGRAAIGVLPVYDGGGSLSWDAFVDGELRVYDDVRSEPSRMSTEKPVQSETVLPLGEHGVMNVGSTEPAEFDDTDVSLARIFGATVDAALSRAEREQRRHARRRGLERQNERLAEFASVVSHDLRSPLQVVDGKLDLARAECDSEHLDDAAAAVGRMDALIEDLLTLARQGERVENAEAVDLEGVTEACWRHVETADATLAVDTDLRIYADHDRLEQLLENVFRNAVDHGGTDVSVSVGGSGETGFFIADDGPGVPADRREQVFERGYSTADGGTGFGLAIVQEVAEAHGWSVTITDAESGGARVEVTAVEAAA
jgi:PAS domain S-box